MRHLARFKKPRKLSKTQKAILESLYSDKGKHTGIRHLQPVEVTSWYIAQRFNQKKSKHIQDRDQLFFQHATEVKSLINKKESAPYDEDLEKELRIRMLVLEFMSIYPYKKKKTLTPKHSASFSRSIRRLEERGLLLRITRYEKQRTNRAIIYAKNTKDRRTQYIYLTKKGEKVSKILFN